MVNNLPIDDYIKSLGKGIHRIVRKNCDIRIFTRLQASDPVIHTSDLSGIDGHRLQCPFHGHALFHGQSCAERQIPDQ